MSKDKESKPKPKDIDKLYADNFSTAQDIIDRPQTIINVSPTIDVMLGGGVPSGSFVIVTGKQKLGKTTMCLHLCGKAQQKDFKVYYFNVEGRIKSRDLLGIPSLSLDKDKFVVIESMPGKILNAEDYLTILNHKLETEQNCVFLMDSISQLCSGSRRANDVGDRFRDDVPLMLADLTKRAANILPVNNNILICITHIIANQGNGHLPWMEASGQKVQYAMDIKLKATHKTDYLVGEKQVGQIVHWQCDSSALGPPNVKSDSLLRYGQGIDEYYDLLQMCTDLGLVAKGGSWLTIGEQKIQGMEKGRAYLKDNPDVYTKLVKQFKELVS